MTLKLTATTLGPELVFKSNSKENKKSYPQLEGGNKRERMDDLSHGGTGDGKVAQQLRIAMGTKALRN